MAVLRGATVRVVFSRKAKVITELQLQPWFQTKIGYSWFPIRGGTLGELAGLAKECRFMNQCVNSHR